MLFWFVQDDSLCWNVFAFIQINIRRINVFVASFLGGSPWRQSISTVIVAKHVHLQRKIPTLVTHKTLEKELVDDVFTRKVSDKSLTQA